MKNKSEKILSLNLWITKYLLIAIPFVIWVCAWAMNLASEGIYVEPKTLLWEILSWNFLAWFILLVYFILSMVFWRAFREKILTKATFSNERDERESYISGRASKTTFYSTLAVLILMFFLSGLHLHIYKKPKEEAVDGKRGTLTISYSFNFINKADKKNFPIFDNSKNEPVFIMDGLPFTQESLLLFIILYHISSYHVFTRKRFEEA